MGTKPNPKKNVCGAKFKIFIRVAKINIFEI